MMQMFVHIAIGLAGGLLGGLGMGGGTLLIPLLTTFGGVEQHAAQAVNLVVFVPMAVVALCIHWRNGLVKFGYLLYIGLPACVSSVLAAWVVGGIDGGLLRMLMGIFLVLLGIYQLVNVFWLQKKPSGD